MLNFFKKPKEKIFNLKGLERDKLIYRILPHFLLEILKKYLRVEVEGIENIPKSGPALVIANHSGFAGFDAVILAYIINKERKRIPRVLTHKLWFLNSTTALPARKMGFTEATTENGVKELNKRNVVVIFPEGENGNFKPTSKMYQLQEFKRGFLNMAITAEAPIIPTLVIGAEETHINLSRLKFTRFLRGTVIPLPLNLIPLPVRWKIKFLPPIHLPLKASQVSDRELMRETALDIQEQMQSALVKEIKKHKRF